MASNRVFVVGASAGGVEALKQLVGLLPADFPSPILIVLHISPYGTSVLPTILSRRGHLSAKHAEHGEHILAGRIYIAPPDRHLLVKHGHAVLSRGPRENNTRPAVDANPAARRCIAQPKAHGNRVRFQGRRHPRYNPVADIRKENC